MKIYFEPINIKEWNMFDKVSGVGHIEGFIATKSMEVNDLVLLNVGKQDNSYESGVYAIGQVISEPFICLDQQDCHCYGRLTVNVEVLKMNYDTPIICYKDLLRFNTQFRTTHMIEEKYYGEILKMIIR